MKKQQPNYPSPHLYYYSNNNTSGTTHQLHEDEKDHTSVMDLLIRWIEIVIVEKLPVPYESPCQIGWRDQYNNAWDSFLFTLRSGKYLCRLMDRLHQALGISSTALYHHDEVATQTSSIAAQNLQNYIDACKALGVSEKDCFEPLDLLNSKHVEKVIQNILSLKNLVTERMSLRFQRKQHLMEYKQASHQPHSNSTLSLSSSLNQEKSSISWEAILNEYETVQWDFYLMESNQKSNDGIEQVSFNLWHIGERIKNMIQTNYSCSLPSSTMESINLNEKLHGKLWLLMSGALLQMKKNEGYYSSLFQIEDTDSEAFRQIEADVPRTILNEDDESEDEITKKLGRILLNYAVHNPVLGYCQGMNFITARMLQFISDEEQVFWLLDRMIQMVPFDYYTSMVGVAVDQHVFSDLVDMFEPQIQDHFKTLGGSGMELSLVCTEWFLTLFSSPYPKEMTMWIWDALFTFGIDIIFRVAFVLISKESSEILACLTYADAVSYLNEIGIKQHFPQEVLFHALNQSMVDATKIDHLRSIHRLHLASDLMEASPLYQKVFHKNKTKMKGFRTKASILRKSVLQIPPHKYREAISYTRSESIPNLSQMEVKTQTAVYYQPPIHIIEDYWTNESSDRSWIVCTKKIIDGVDGKLCKKAEEKNKLMLPPRPSIKTEIETIKKEKDKLAHAPKWLQRIEEWKKGKKKDDILTRPGLQRQVSVPLSLPSPLNTERQLRERAHVLSYLQHHYKEEGNETMIQERRNSFSFLDRISINIDQCLDTLDDLPSSPEELEPSRTFEKD